MNVTNVAFDVHDAAAAREIDRRGRVVRRSDMVEYCGDEEKADALLKRLVGNGVLKYVRNRRTYTSGQGWTLTTNDHIYRLSDVGMAISDLYPNKDGQVTIH